MPQPVAAQHSDTFDYNISADEPKKKKRKVPARAGSTKPRGGGKRGGIASYFVSGPAAAAQPDVLRDTVETLARCSISTMNEVRQLRSAVYEVLIVPSSSAFIVEAKKATTLYAQQAKAKAGGGGGDQRFAANARGIRHHRRVCVEDPEDGLPSVGQQQ